MLIKVSRSRSLHISVWILNQLDKLPLCWNKRKGLYLWQGKVKHHWKCIFGQPQHLHSNSFHAAFDQILFALGFSILSINYPFIMGSPSIYRSFIWTLICIIFYNSRGQRSKILLVNLSVTSKKLLKYLNIITVNFSPMSSYKLLTLTLQEYWM